MSTSAPHVETRWCVRCMASICMLETQEMVLRGGCTSKSNAPSGGGGPDPPRTSVTLYGGGSRPPSSQRHSLGGENPTLSRRSHSHSHGSRTANVPHKSIII